MSNKRIFGAHFNETNKRLPICLLHFKIPPPEFLFHSNLICKLAAKREPYCLFDHLQIFSKILTDSEKKQQQLIKTGIECVDVFWARERIFGYRLRLRMSKFIVDYCWVIHNIVATLITVCVCVVFTPLIWNLCVAAYKQFIKSCFEISALLKQVTRKRPFNVFI